MLTIDYILDYTRTRKILAKDISSLLYYILMTVEKIPILQVAYKSEWALAKFFQALKEGEIPEKFILKTICGREDTKELAYKALKKAVMDRVKYLEDGGCRSGNRTKEIDSILELMEGFFSNGIKYLKTNRNKTLVEEAYEGIEGVIIHSKNTTHRGYIKQAFDKGKHIICEKPLVTVLDEWGNADERDLKFLEDIVNSNNGLVLMDAEHYSYKKPSIIFYEKLEEILSGSRIRGIEGYINEIDDPNFGRTKDVLNLENRTGILTDTVIHLLAFISNLGGKAVPTSARYGIYKGYDVETGVKAEYNIEGNSKYFMEGAKASFQAMKFIDKQIKPENQETKLIKFSLEDDSEIIINFRDGTLKKSKGGVEQDIKFRFDINKNEYVNILNFFNEAVGNHTKPRTDFRNSAVTLRSIYETYRDFPIQENKWEVYRCE